MALHTFIEYLRHPYSVPLYLVLVATVLYRLIKRMVVRTTAAGHIAKGTGARMLATLRVAAALIVVLFSLQSMGIIQEAWAILSASIAALAVAFVATWSVLSNVTSAGIILGFRPFRLGDHVAVYSGDKLLVSGKVLDLNLMFTTIEDGNSASRVPNNLFLQNVVRVTRAGKAPNPAEDNAAPFF